MNNEEKKSINEFIDKLSNTLPFMDGKEKGSSDELLDEILTITDYGFMRGDKGDYSVFIVKEIPEKFFFGGMVITEDLKEFDTNGYYDEIKMKGLQIQFSKVVSRKTGKTYTNVQYIKS